MSHTDIIIIASTLLFVSTFGVYAAIRVINKHTRPPVNTLVRSGDIELVEVDYIEPTQPHQIYNYPDLLGSQHPIFERFSGGAPSYWSGTPPSYQTGTPPSYQSIDRWGINSSLESVINIINFDFILRLILFFILVFIIIILIRIITKLFVKVKNFNFRLLFVRTLNKNIYCNLFKFIKMSFLFDILLAIIFGKIFLVKYSFIVVKTIRSRFVRKNINIKIMNLNKYTKAELISKISKFKEEKIERRSFFNRLKTYFSSYFNFLLKLKSIIGKLTLISFFIQLFRKYKILRWIWNLINTIVMSIFSISLIDSFAFEFISNFFAELRLITSNIIDYFSNTKFYTFLNKLFSNKEDIPTKDGRLSSKVYKEYNDNETKMRSEEREGKTNTKISEWLKPKAEFNKTEITNETSYTKYFIIGGVIVFSCLAWVYADEIKTGGRTLLDWIFSFWSGGDDDEGNNTDSSRTPTAINIPGSGQLKSEISSPEIETIDLKGKDKVLTSDSMENLNEKIREEWSDTET
jgi:hypothetical protein